MLVVERDFLVHIRMIVLRLRRGVMLLRTASHSNKTKRSSPNALKCLLETQTNWDAPPAALPSASVATFVETARAVIARVGEVR